MSGRAAVIVFARDPRLEAANKPLVAGRSVAVHAALLADTVERLRATRSDLVLAWQGEMAKAWELRPRCVVEQRGRTFGERIVRALRDTATLGYERVAIVAADCPALLAVDVVQALEELERVDAVLGPAADGGVNLIALRAGLLAKLDIEPLPWETGALFGALEHAFEQAGLVVSVRPPAEDIDGPEDLARFVIRAPSSRLARLVKRAMGGGLTLAQRPIPRPGRSNLPLFGDGVLRDPVDED